MRLRWRQPSGNWRFSPLITNSWASQRSMKMGGLQHSENESLTAIFEGMIAPCIDIWDTDSAPPQGTSALYVAISGNTAAGKSSLIAELERRLCRLGFPAVGISERVFHHQYLRLMFSNPRDFAFPIQLSFLSSDTWCCCGTW